MITIELFIDAIVKWINTTILPKIPGEATALRGLLRGGGELARIRPDTTFSLLLEKVPMAKDFGFLLFRAGEVDAEAIRTVLPPIFEEIKELDLAEYIPGFTYKTNAEEIKTLCKFLAQAEGAASLGKDMAQSPVTIK